MAFEKRSDQAFSRGPSHVRPTFPDPGHLDVRSTSGVQSIGDGHSRTFTTYSAPSTTTVRTGACLRRRFT